MTFWNILSKYHNERLKLIYQTRKNIGFTSIQSVADEINSLKSISIHDAEILFNNHNKFLKDFETVVTTKNISYPFITNTKGELFLENYNINETELDESQFSSANKSLATSYKSGLFTKDFEHVSYNVKWEVGRTYSRNWLGIRTYKSYTKYSFYTLIKSTGTTRPNPAIFSPDSDSQAGFENFTHPFLGEFWFVDFPSGSGVSVTKTGKSSTATINLFGSIKSSGTFEYPYIVTIEGDHFEQL